MPKNLKIGNHIIGPREPVFIIAEAGVNHNGRLDLALKLIDAAADAGADAVKFQTFKAEQVTIGSGEMADYQKRNIGKTMSQIEMVRGLEIKDAWYRALLRHCNKKNIIFMSAPHGHTVSADLLKKLRLKVYKIASGDLINRPLLEHVAHFDKPMIISSGMADMAEVKEAVAWVKKADNDKVVVLHCTTNYPCPAEEVNLAAMQTIMKQLPGIPVGYSDHTRDNQASLMAVTLGACVIEKHLTLDKNLPGPDHKGSLEPEEFKAFVKALRNVSVILGSPDKKPNKSELETMRIVRKSIVTTAAIRKGEKLTEKNLGIKRPGNGIHPKYYHSLLGKKANRDIANDVLLVKQDINE